MNLILWICVSSKYFSNVSLCWPLPAPSQLYTSTKTIVVTTTTTTTYTYTPAPSPTKHTPDTTSIGATKAVLQVQKSAAPETTGVGAQIKQPQLPSSYIIDPKDLVLPSVPTICLPSEIAYDPQGSSTQAIGSTKTFADPHLSPAWSKSGGILTCTFFSPSNALPRQSVSSSMPVQLSPKASSIFRQHYSRIIHLRDRQGAQIGINIYHVVLCGQKVGIFYDE